MKTVYTAKELNTALIAVKETHRKHPDWKDGDFWVSNFESFLELAMMNKPSYTFDMSTIPELRQLYDMIERMITDSKSLISVMKYGSRK